MYIKIYVFKNELRNGYLLACKINVPSNQHIFFKNQIIIGLVKGSSSIEYHYDLSYYQLLLYQAL